MEKIDRDWKRLLNISLVRQKNAEETIIKEEKARMTQNGEDWTGLLMTIKYQFGEI